MAITMDQANALLANVQNETELRTLISQLDVTATGKVTMLYGGTVGNVGGSVGNISLTTVVQEMLASGADIRVIDNTEAAHFLDIGKNPILKDALIRIFNGSDPDIKGSRIQL